MDISSVEPANITLTLSNQNNLRADWARSDFDVPQRFVASYIYATPMVNHFGFLGHQVLSNWQLNGITTFSTGQPFTVFSGIDSNLDGISTDRPNAIANPVLKGLSRSQKIREQFNTSAFVAVPAGVPYGNVRRNSLIGPGFINTDFSGFKDFPLGEFGRLQFRAEMFNIFNNVNLANPNATLTSSSFGKITALNSNSAPRIAQFALRYNF
jgi:hypothetical protein